MAKTNEIFCGRQETFVCMSVKFAVPLLDSETVLNKPFCPTQIGLRISKHREYYFLYISFDPYHLMLFFTKVGFCSEIISLPPKSQG